MVYSGACGEVRRRPRGGDEEEETGMNKAKLDWKKRGTDSKR